MSKFRFDKKARAINTDVLLTRMGNNAVNYFKVDVFNAQAFDGNAWKEKKVQDGRRTLVKTGRTRASIRVLKKGRNYIQVGTDVPYAKYQNEGTKTIPQRQFIGKSREITRYNKKSVDLAVKEALHKR